MNLGIQQKYALITGGSRGIGRSIAIELAAEGCNVAICARTPRDVNATCSEIKKLGVDCLGVVADVLNPSDIDTVIRKISERWGTIHILVNNVGGGGRWGSEDILSTDDGVWTEVFAKNALTAAKFTSAVIPWMKAQKWGRVVTITSIYGQEGGGRPWFNMAKAAQTSLMKSFGRNRDWARVGITFNSVAPGPIMIPNTGWEKEKLKDPEAFESMVQSNFVAGRLGLPEEIAAVVTFLCSERAALVNGASIAVDGGQSRSF